MTGTDPAARRDIMDIIHRLAGMVIEGGFEPLTGVPAAEILMPYFTSEMTTPRGAPPSS